MLMLMRVVVGGFIQKVRRGAAHQKSLGKPRRHPQLFMTVLAQPDPGPFAKCRRALACTGAAGVDEDFALGHLKAYQIRWLVRRSLQAAARQFRLAGARIPPFCISKKVQ